MISALDKALDQIHASSHSAFERAWQLKRAGTDLVPMLGDSTSGYFPYSSNSGAREKYSQFRGWLYSAVHALALEAAGQPLQIARLKGSLAREEDQRLTKPGMHKNTILKTMPKSLRTKAAATEFEVLFDHPLLDQLEQPNPIQSRWEFVYRFVANLNLTGWAYLVGGETEDGRLEIYSLPTTWVTPIHKGGAFSGFWVGDPDDPNTKKGVPLGPENVKVSCLPNPGHPLGAMAPSASQSQAIQIDEYIQSSQRAFFENGVFHGLVVTVGKDPHPEVPGGIRPRLTNAQRRQIIGSIQKAMAGPQRYGETAIVDGLIEKIERVSATSNEMGWDKSEDKTRTRILSAYGVHPYILGEPVSVGGSRQVADIHLRFCKRVNTFLEMLSYAVSKFISSPDDGQGRIIAWWENCEYPDPSLYWLNVRNGRANGDLSKNEYRAELGFPPDENDVGPRSKILDNPNGMMALATMLGMISSGQIGNEAGTIIVSLFLQIPEEEAALIVADSEGRQAVIGAPENQVQGEIPPPEDFIEPKPEPSEES